MENDQFNLIKKEKRPIMQKINATVSADVRIDDI